LIFNSRVTFKILECETNNENDCAICLQSLNKGNYAALLQCKHVFHQDCFEKWLMIKKNCPLCKSIP
jgi:hypothetical protein